MVSQAGFAEVLTSPFSRQRINTIEDRFPLDTENPLVLTQADDFAWELNTISYEGTFCVVTQARPAGRNGAFSYAVKQLKKPWQHSPIGKLFLCREAELGQIISHPHIVPTLDANTECEVPYLVQPWIQGKTLHELLSRRRIAKPAEAIWLARQIAEALATMEKHDFCHSDIKPSNVIVSPDGHATLIDLGLARRTGEPELPFDRAVVGTPKYMAPELTLSDASQAIDIRADLYSLGLVMLEMLFGQSILSADGVSHRINIGQWRTLWDALGGRLKDQKHSLADLENLLRSMTSADAAKRPRSAEDLVRRLIPLEFDMI